MSWNIIYSSRTLSFVLNLIHAEFMYTIQVSWITKKLKSEESRYINTLYNTSSSPIPKPRKTWPADKNHPCHIRINILQWDTISVSHWTSIHVKEKKTNLWPQAIVWNTCTALAFTCTLALNSGDIWRTVEWDELNAQWRHLATIS